MPGVLLPEALLCLCFFLCRIVLPSGWANSVSCQALLLGLAPCFETEQSFHL